jgi:hypothetical protein
MAFVKLLETYNREVDANRGSSTHTELELRFSIRSLDEYKRLLLGILKDSEISSVSYSVAIIKRENSSIAKPAGHHTATQPNIPDKIATREYTEQDGKLVKSETLTFSSKKRVEMERVMNEFVEYRAAVSLESPAEKFDIGLFSILRMKLRLSVIVSDFPDWRFDFTLVNEMTSLTQEFATRRDALFKAGLCGDNFVASAPFNAAKLYEFEVEYIGPSSPSVADMYKIIDFVRIAGGFNNTQGARYQEVIYEIAKLMYPPSKAANFRAKLGRKALGPSVIGLSRDVYFKEILPKIVGTRVTIKLNGEGVLGRIIGNVSEAVGGSLIESKTAESVSSPIVYDSEYVAGRQHVFDVYVCDGQNLLESADLGVREKYIPRVVSILGPDVAAAKVHILLTENYAQELTDLWEKRDPKLPADGLIFNNMYKWKPIEELTIDFLTMRDPSMSGRYFLFAGINKSQSRQYGIRPLKDYNKIFQGRSFHDYYPIQFAPGDKPNAYVFIADRDTPDIHNRICEYSYSTSSGAWKFMRIREDRDIEVARGSYFGNNIAVAIGTWNSIHDPLTFDMLRSLIGEIPETSVGYFGTTDQMYAMANRFSSFVKEQSIKSFKGLSWVADFACGRGADIGRWPRLGIKNALCVDNDAEALKELMSRHHGNQRRLSHYKLAVYTVKANLNDPHDTLLDLFRASAPSMPPGVPLAVCNMAIHYMCESDATIWNFVMLVDKMLEVGGHFVFTCYNGARVFDLLGDKEQVDLTVESVTKYSIKRDYKVGTFKNYGQSIQTLLGCAGGIYRAEFLVNIPYIIRMFKSRGFKLVNQVRFDSLLSEYSIDHINNYDALDDADHDHLALYDYVILQKEKSVGSSSADKKADEITSIVALPPALQPKHGTSHMADDDLKAAALIIHAPKIEQLPTKDIKVSINIKNAEDISSGRVKVIILPNQKWPGMPKVKKDGTIGKKIPMREIVPGDRINVNGEFEVVVDEVAIVSTYKLLPDKFSISELSATAQTRDEWLAQFEANEAARLGVELMGLRVRKL